MSANIELWRRAHNGCEGPVEEQVDWHSLLVGGEAELRGSSRFGGSTTVPRC
jgi:hypothetical protein